MSVCLSVVLDAFVSAAAVVLCSLTQLFTFCVKLYRIWLFQIRPEPDFTGFRNSNSVGSGFEENLFLDRRTIHLMKLMASAMLSAAIKRQYSSVLPLLRHSLPVFDKICGMVME